MKPLYRIDRIIPGGFRDSLIQLGSDTDDLEGLPCFGGRKPAIYESKDAAKAVADHLRVWFPRTDPIPGVANSLDIEYQVVPIQCHYTTHIGMDFKNDHADLFCVQLVGHDDTAHAIVNITNGLVTQVQTVTSLSLRQSALIRLALMHYRRARAVAVA